MTGGHKNRELADQGNPTASSVLPGTVYVITSATLNLEVLSSTTTAQARCGKEHEDFE
jgi:hypothetical protein